MRIVQLSTDLVECQLEYPDWTFDDGTTATPPPNWDDVVGDLWAMDGHNGNVVLSINSETEG